MGDASHSNGELQNGFMDPRVLEQMNELDLPTTDEASMEESQPSTEITESPEKRKYSFSPTGCCYDARMMFHANADFSAAPHHPEDPRRIQAIFKAFKDAGLIYNGPSSDLPEILKEAPSKWMYRIEVRRALEEEIGLAHSAGHIEWVKALDQKSSADLRAMTKHMDQGRKSLYVGSLTHEAALLSAGGAIETCKNVVAGTCKNAIAIIRPPGHHAEHNQSMGFCIFNNVPIAAKVCMSDYPELCRKVLILDWDVHHGNGIQNMFYEDPNVLYISIHVYQGGHFYPGPPEDEGIPDGNINKCGAGVGIGKNINIGWHDQGMGDGEYMAAFQKIVMPIAEEFDPDLVIISAGFDAAAGDELGGCFVTPACYAHMTHMLMSLANGKVAVCLEGGYNLRAISKSALAVAKTLMGEPPPRLALQPLNKDANYVLQSVRQQHAVYWECMRPGVLAVDRLLEKGGVRMDTVLRNSQGREYYREFKMVSLYVQRNGLANSSFKDQVLCTPRAFEAKKLVVIIHDP